MDITKVIEEIELHDGIWQCQFEQDMISYPAEANIECSKVEQDSYWFAHRVKIITMLASRHCRQTIFFDIGGGNGFNSVALQKAGFDPWVIEPHINGLQSARAAGIVNLINAPFENLKIQTNSIQNAGLFDVLEHIKDDVAFLKSVHKSLCPNGKLLLTIPAYKFLWSEADLNAGHFRRYTIKSASKVLEQAGFKIVYRSYFFAFLILPIFILRSIPFFIGIKSSYSDIKQRKEHKSRSGLISKGLNLLCQFEEQRIKKGGLIHFGSSCIIIAEK